MEDFRKEILNKQKEIVKGISESFEKAQKKTQYISGVGDYPEGTIKDWKGGKVIKQGKKWVPYKEKELTEEQKREKEAKDYYESLSPEDKRMHDFYKRMKPEPKVKGIVPVGKPITFEWEGEIITEKVEEHDYNHGEFGFYTTESRKAVFPEDLLTPEEAKNIKIEQKKNAADNVDIQKELDAFLEENGGRLTRSRGINSEFRSIFFRHGNPNSNLSNITHEEAKSLLASLKELATKVTKRRPEESGISPKESRFSPKEVAEQATKKPYKGGTGFEERLEENVPADFRGLMDKMKEEYGSGKNSKDTKNFLMNLYNRISEESEGARGGVINVLRAEEIAGNLLMLHPTDSNIKMCKKLFGSAHFDADINWGWNGKIG